jgi:hypothetical protein
MCSQALLLYSVLNTEVRVACGPGPAAGLLPDALMLRRVGCDGGRTAAHISAAGDLRRPAAAMHLTTAALGSPSCRANVVVVVAASF